MSHYQNQSYQTPEASAFLERVKALPDGPSVSLDAVLQPSLDDEADLRKLFAQDKANVRLKDPYVGLVNVFAADGGIKRTRARIVNETDEDDLSGKYVMPLTGNRRRKEGTPAMVQDMVAFKRHWAIFSEGSLSQLTDWNNVIVAGGSVQACLASLPDGLSTTKRGIRDYFHKTAFPTSDVDVFLWGLTPEQAEKKCQQIYEAVADSVPWGVTCVRTKHTISIHSQYPYRSIQIVLRLYQSPAEVLAGFDVDAPCCAFDGSRVWANPRAIVAMMRQCNTVDMTRRSPSYEVRLTKYASRDFEILVPSLRRVDVDPTIFERAITRIQGLARLLVLEKLRNTKKREEFAASRRQLRNRPVTNWGWQNSYQYRHGRKYKGDLKDVEATAMGGLELSDYDVKSLHIPYGPGWDARRIEKLVYSTDLGMNSTFNPKNKDRRLHRHPAFFGTLEECIEDCCGACPELLTDEERELQTTEDESYIRGRIQFIEENPGRQSISGSFNPIDVGEWSAQVYLGNTQRLFAAIAAKDRKRVLEIIHEHETPDADVPAVDVNQRDYVGRTALHLAIICEAEDIAKDLVNAGARMTARLVDGRSSLHLAAQTGLADLICLMLQKSDENKRKFEEAAAAKVKEQEARDADEDADMDMDDEDEDESEKDWTSDEEVVVVKKKAENPSTEAQSGEIPEEDEKTPDIFETNPADWDYGFTPLAHAIVHGFPKVIDVLIAAGADATLPSQANGSPVFHPLALIGLIEKTDQIEPIVKKLLAAGATSSSANKEGLTVLQMIICQSNPRALDILLRLDPNAAVALKYPAMSYHTSILPFGMAVALRDWSSVAVLLAHGNRGEITEDDMVHAMQSRTQYRAFGNKKSSLDWLTHPVEMSIANYDYIVKLLSAAGSEINRPLALVNEDQPDTFMNVLDGVREMIKLAEKQVTSTEEQIANLTKPMPTLSFGNWKEFYESAKMLLEDAGIGMRTGLGSTTQTNQIRLQLERQKRTRHFFIQMEQALLTYGAKTWDECHPDKKRRTYSSVSYDNNMNATPSHDGFRYIDQSNILVPARLWPLYEELYEACLLGDNEKIQKLCLPSFNGDNGQEQLRITVALNTSTRYSRGYTPLHAAMINRHWDTVKLVMAVAISQYIPRKEEKNPQSFREHLVQWDDEDEDSDNESDYSGEFDTPMRDINALNFVDIAKRPSTIQCDTNPVTLLESAAPILKDGLTTNSIPLITAISHKDPDAFKTILGLYAVLGKASKIPDHMLDNVLASDSVEMLDILIRKTGWGLDLEDIPEEPSTEEEVDTKHSKKPAFYLGLDVHGKKRKDLASHSDPNGRHGMTAKMPILWKAIRLNVPCIVEYLASEKVVDAYATFAKHGDGDSALQLRRVRDLHSWLPERLGWGLSRAGESPLIAAVSIEDARILKVLFRLAPQEMTKYLNEKVKYIGYNALLIAANCQSSEEMFDCLLDHDISVIETDTPRGWNVFHILAHVRNDKLTRHLLKKLDQDTVRYLLRQTSSNKGNTPIHEAVKAGSFGVVDAFIEFDSSLALDIRDVDGSTPLHTAISKGYLTITKALLQSSTDSVLYSENGVGHTPLDIATHRDLLWRSRSKYNDKTSQYSGYYFSIPSLPLNSLPSGNIPKTRALSAEINRLNSTVRYLDETAAFSSDPSLRSEILKFIQDMEDVARERAFEDDEDDSAQKQKSAVDVSNSEEVAIAVKDAIKSRPGMRRLTHILDVQRSVSRDLAKKGEQRWTTAVDKYAGSLYMWSRSMRRKTHDGELGSEEEQDVKDIARSMVYSGHLVARELDA